MSGVEENALKQAAVLAKRVTHSFCEPLEIVLFDLVLRRTLAAAEAANTVTIRMPDSNLTPEQQELNKPGIVSVNEIADLTNHSKRQTKIGLTNLERAGLLVRHSLRDPIAIARGSQAQSDYFSFDHRAFALRLKYRFLKLTKIFENQATTEAPLDMYSCTDVNCPDFNKAIDVHEANMSSKNTFGDDGMPIFCCSWCSSLLRKLESESMNNAPVHTLRARFNAELGGFHEQLDRVGDLIAEEDKELKERQEKEAALQGRKSGRGGANAPIVVKLQAPIIKKTSKASRSNAEKPVPWKKRKFSDTRILVKEAEGARDLFDEDTSFEKNSLDKEFTPAPSSDSQFQIPPNFDIKAYELEKNRQESTILRYGSVIKAIVSEQNSVDQSLTKPDLPSNITCPVQGEAKSLDQIDQADIDLMTDDEFNLYATTLQNFRIPIR